MGALTTKMIIRFGKGLGTRTECTGEEYTADIAGVVIRRGRFQWLYPWHTIASVESEEVDEP